MFKDIELNTMFYDRIMHSKLIVNTAGSCLRGSGAEKKKYFNLPFVLAFTKLGRCSEHKNHIFAVTGLLNCSSNNC